MSNKTSHALQLTYPVLLGYLSVGFIFGVLLKDIHQGTLYSFCASLFLYAGAAQFLLLNLVKTATPLSQAFTAIFLLNVRHIFYYLPVERKLPQNRILRTYCTLALTDETFAVLTSPETRQDDALRVTAFNHLYWIVGCTAGAFIGSLLSSRVDGLDFALTALFIVLCLDKIHWRQDRWIILATLVIAIITKVVIPADYFILVVIVSSLIAAQLLRKR